MDGNEYQEMGSHPCFAAGMPAGEMTYPKLYYKIHPFVMEACDEMDAYGVAMPTNHIMHCMRDRICEKVFRVYPEMARFDVEFEAQADPPPVAPGLADQFRRMFPGESLPGSLEDLRRRHPREFEEFRREHPESFRRGNVFRDFILFLIFLELFRRRRRF